MKKRIFILNGHPAQKSLNKSLATCYATAARAAGHEVRLIHIDTLDFDIDYGLAGTQHHKPLEDGLEQLIGNLEWCEHFVLLSPMWWGGIPAKLKGAFDRSLLPGRAYDTRVPAGKMPRPMLEGRTARVILTSDTPRWFLSLMYRSALIHQLRGQVLNFIGFRPARFTFLSGASKAPDKTVAKWLSRIDGLGSAAA
ncbi:NAD(P)H-dependent oxidoreductase [Sulfitobacter sp. S190]|uniref:NAD(P)H-dependent oxidoreductase n=1 Tax=Sulfitobacter sp. S190 TaxID=2867022 RepID=UPI0021A49808|nr:NAD(P)H-dependent oxidoreductase [Sulfitobacter sp. S190]UWR22796.1 NAD(P)H-dependent oxidoreductase [Sulfitobacter sp. S190]